MTFHGQKTVERAKTTGKTQTHGENGQKTVGNGRKALKNKAAVQDFITMVELKLAGILTDYYNYLLRNDLPLPAKQNLIRQIYLPKTSEVY